MSGNVIPYRMQQKHGCYANEIAFSGYLLSRQSRYLSAVVSESSECQESMYASETALFEYFHPAEAGVTLPLYGEISDFGALKKRSLPTRDHSLRLLSRRSCVTTTVRSATSVC